MDTINTILFFLSDNWEVLCGIGVSIWGLIIRRIPTDKDLTIIGNVKKILDLVVKNKRKPSSIDNVLSGDSGKNIVVLKRDEHI